MVSYNYKLKKCPTTENTGSIARPCNFSTVQLLLLAMMTISKKNMHENTIIKTGQQWKTLVPLLCNAIFYCSIAVAGTDEPSLIVKAI
jgi:hypothetical protein